MVKKTDWAIMKIDGKAQRRVLNNHPVKLLETSSNYSLIFRRGSIQAQLRACREWASSNDLKLVKE